MSSAPAKNDFDDESATSAKSQYVAALTTTAAGVIQSKVQNVSDKVNNKVVSLTPYSDAALTTVMAAADYKQGTNKPVMG